jgi:preprotein translocase subunit SecD
MNRYPLWKNLLILFVLLVGGLYALPNLFGDDPAVQVSATRHGNVDLALTQQAEQALTEAGIDYKGVSLEDNKLLIRLTSNEAQLKAKETLSQQLSEDYIIALNLAPSTPEWLVSLGAEPMNLGLDLRGGVHFLMEVDMDAAIKLALQSYESDLRLRLRDEKLRYKQIDVAGEQVVVTLRNADKLADVESLLRREFSDLTLTISDETAQPVISLKMSEASARETKKLALQQNITTIRNRINELGVAEPTVQQQGDNRIVVQLPGVQDTAQAKKILGATATLEFRLVDFEHDVQDALAGRIPPNSQLFYHRDGRPYLLDKRVMLTGEHVINAQSTLDPQSGTPAVSVTLDAKGANIFKNITRENIGNPMSVVFIESKSEMKEVDGELVKVRTQLPEIINVATIRDQLSKKFQITGLDSSTEALELALLLRAGALAAPIDIIEERTVGPSLGKDNIEQGFESVIIGFVLVLVFMLIWYRLFGLFANVALAANLILIVALLSMLQATLTLPGIAGIVLTVGMAVDANVLIFERIREELRNGLSPQASINAGYGRAFSTIADANITTLIAAIVLFGFGTGTIKGFAVTLTFGIITSMFTAIMLTRALVNYKYGRQHKPTLSI